jgi:hypothetical protein
MVALLFSNMLNWAEAGAALLDSSLKAGLFFACKGLSGLVCVEVEVFCGSGGGEETVAGLVLWVDVVDGDLALVLLAATGGRDGEAVLPTGTLVGLLSFGSGTLRGLAAAGENSTGSWFVFAVLFFLIR